MSENIENDAVVEETTPVAEPEVETEAPVVEETPVAEPVTKAPKAVVNGDSGNLGDNTDNVILYAAKDVKLNKLNKTLPAGFSAVPFNEARVWLALGSVRPATPTEVAKELGK